jgi:hypothetical protein
MKRRLTLVAIGVLFILGMSGCFVSDDNDDNPANAVSPSTILTGNYVMSLTITPSVISSDPSSGLPSYSEALLRLTNSDGAPVAGQLVTVFASELEEMVGFCETIGDGWVIVQGFSVHTNSSGYASFYVGRTVDSDCTNGSIPIVAQAFVDQGSNAPMAVAYGNVGLSSPPDCVPLPK